MKIKFHKNFENSFKKLDQKLRQKVIDRIGLFVLNPHDQKLKNHALSGNLLGMRSFSVNGDCSVIFEEIDDYVLVIFLDVGTHNQVY